MEILRLKDLLSEKGVSGKTLAENVGVTPASISNIAQGNSFPKPELLLKIAASLEVDIRDLFYPTTEVQTETVYAFRDGKYVPVGELNK